MIWPSRRLALGSWVSTMTSPGLIVGTMLPVSIVAVR
jgi:hypothetical protein